MAFKTIEEANEYQLKMDKQYADLKTAHDGLKTKVETLDKDKENLNSEISRLKIKNYEYFEQITTSQKNTNQNDDDDNNQTLSNDEVFDNCINELMK